MPIDPRSIMRLDPRILERISNPTGGKLTQLGGMYNQGQQDVQKMRMLKQKQGIEMDDISSKLMKGFTNAVMNDVGKGASADTVRQSQMKQMQSAPPQFQQMLGKMLKQPFGTYDDVVQANNRAKQMQVALHPEQYDDSKNSVWSKINPKDYTSDSIRIFARTKNYDDLRTIDDPSDKSSFDLVSLEKEGKDGVMEKSFYKDEKIEVKKHLADGWTVRKGKGQTFNIGAKEDSKFTYSELGKAVDDARYAVKEKQNLEYIKRGMEGIGTGKLTDAKVWINELASSLDLPVSNDMANLESAGTAMGNLVMAGLNNFPGQISNEERKYVASIMPKLTQTPKGREQIIEFLGRLSDRRVEYRKQMIGFVSKHSSLMTKEDSFYSRWDKYEEDNPVLDGLDLLVRQGNKAINSYDDEEKEKRYQEWKSKQ